MKEGETMTTTHKIRPNDTDYAGGRHYDGLCCVCRTLAEARRQLRYYRDRDAGWAVLRIFARSDGTFEVRDRQR
jgi:hypothetical protein